MSKIINRLFEDIGEGIPWYRSVYYFICRKSFDIKYFFQRLYERLKYGFPLYQAWDFCGWHSQIVVPRLKHLRENKVGYPMGTEEVEWTEILDKIIWAFENSDTHPSPIYSEDYDHRYEVTKENGFTTYTPLNKTGTVDWSPIQEHNKKIQEGLDLFAKYYLTLWD